MVAPTFSLPTTGTDPKTTTKATLEQAVQIVLDALQESIDTTALAGAIGTGTVYQSTAAGLADTSDGDTFMVAASGQLTAYLNDGGSETELATLPTQTQVDNARAALARRFEEVGDMTGDALLTYTGGSVYTVAAGDVIEAQGFRYEVAVSGTSDHDLTTAGGVKLYFAPEDAGVPVTAANGDNTDTTDSASAMVSALSASSAIVPVGTFKMKPTGTSPFLFGNSAVNNIYRAVALTTSDRAIRGHGTVHGISRDSVGATDIQPVFCTDKNADVGDIRNLSFEGVGFDPENDADMTNSNQRFAYLVGVDRVRFYDTYCRSSGNRRGYYAHIQNSRNVQIIGHTHQKVTGGINTRYIDNLVMAGCLFDDFSEAIDLDGTSNRAIVAATAFESTSRSNQAIDVNSQVDGVFTGLTFANLGNIATINYKYTTPDNYADYVDNETPTSLTPSQRIVFQGFTGTEIGASVTPSLYIGEDRAENDAWAGYRPVHDILVSDFFMKDASYIEVQEAQNLRLSRFGMEDVIAPVARPAAIWAQSQSGDDNEVQDSDLDLAIEHGRITGSERGAVRISNPSRVSIFDLYLRDNDTEASAEPAVRLTALQGRGAAVFVDGLDTDGGVTINGDRTLVSAWAGSTAYVVNEIVENGGLFYRCTTAGTSASSGGPTTKAVGITDGTVTWEWLPEPFSIIWGPNNRLKPGAALTLQGDAHTHIHGKTVVVPIGDIAATANKTVIAYIAERRCRIARATFMVTAGITADGSNYRGALLKSRLDGVEQSIGSWSTVATSVAAYEQTDLGMTAT
ncbi:MAG: hypothetical protein EP318_15380, partial [Rhodobacteraceae bacterium]